MWMGRTSGATTLSSLEYAQSFLTIRVPLSSSAARSRLRAPELQSILPALWSCVDRAGVDRRLIWVADARSFAYLTAWKHMQLGEPYNADRVSHPRYTLAD